MTNPPAKYDAAGNSDNNIKTKKTKQVCYMKRFSWIWPGAIPSGMSRQISLPEE
jgi:hypothetical protein